MAKTLKRDGFILEGQSKKGIVKFRISIKSYPRTNKRNSYKRFRMRATANGLKIDQEFDDEWKCRKFFNDWQSENDPNEGGWRTTTTFLTPTELNDAQIAIKSLPKGATLIETVTQYKQREAIKEITLIDAWTEYRAHNIKTEKNKDGGWVSDATIKEQDLIFKPILKKLGGIRVKTIDEEDLPKFWENKKSSRTRLNRFTKIRSFFSWCKNYRYH